MANVKLTLACIETDRSRPILDGRVTVPGAEFTHFQDDAQVIFRRTLQEAAFELAELSMGSHITTTAARSAKYWALPVFLSRSFRHSCIYVRTDRGITSAADLKGRRIGIADYAQTAVLWLRGILHDQYGVAASDVSWRTGGMEQAGAPVRLALDLPSRLDVKRIGDADSLNSLLVAGELDAIISPMAPSCFAQKTAPVARLFPEYREAEMAYYRQTKFFPIMHVLTIRKDVAEAHPELPLALFNGFAKAKAIVMGELDQSGVLKTALPWLVSHAADTRALMGANFWPYGLAANKAEVAAMCRYAHEDGLAPRLVEPEELFHPSTLNAPDAM